jgi:sugar lactone lactonase YvrE
VFIDDDQTLYVADFANHRIMEWKRNAINGQIVAGGNGEGNRNDQLNYPIKVIIDKKNDSLIICNYGNRKLVRWSRRNGRSGETLISNIDCFDLIMDNDGYLYVSNKEIHEVRRWKMGETEGTIVAGGNGKGNRLDQLNTPRYIFIDEDHSVYVSDEYNHRVMKWMKGAKEGVVVAGGQGPGNSLRQLSMPHGIIVDQLGSVYVTDYGNDRVMRWLKGAEEGTIVVGGNGRGNQPNEFNCPTDLSFDRQNNLYVVDWYNHRVQRFEVNSNESV